MSKLRLYPSGKEIDVKDGETVLSALERQGYALPNNCRAGACGECKVIVKSGQYDQGFVLDMALSLEEKEKGYGLMCMAKPTSDILEIEWGDKDVKQKLFPPEENRPYLVTEKQTISPSIVKIKLRSLGRPMRFWPGQYITLGTPKRSYSIANIPNSEGEIVLLVTKVKDGEVSTWIHDKLQEGDSLNISGPYGTFIGDPSAETPVLCLAAGSGLAPILSLSLAALLRGGFKHPVTLFFSARTEKDLIEKGLLVFLSKKFRNFEFKYTLTGKKNSHDIQGRIPDILGQYFPDLSPHSVYIAGSTEFVESCVHKVSELGALTSLIHTEGFTSAPY